MWAPAPLRSISLGYSISHRRVYDYGIGSDLPPEEYLPLLGLADPGAVGSLEQDPQPERPHARGELRPARPDRQPAEGLRDPAPGRDHAARLQHQRVCPGRPRRHGLSAADQDRWASPLRAGAGRIYPRGNSIEAWASESPFVSLLSLRDVTFTAGGTRDVRGWGTLLVGPKLPQVQLEQSGDSTVAVADRYTPIGGLARLVGSVELHFPMPLLGEAFPALPVLRRRPDLDPRPAASRSMRA